MCNTNNFKSKVTNKDYNINFSLNYDSSNVVYLLEYAVCGIQYVGSTCTPFRTRFNHYKTCNRKFKGDASGVPQADIFRNFAVEGHRGFLEDIKTFIIDRLFGNGRQRESCWQCKLDTAVPQGLNTRQVDICS